MKRAMTVRRWALPAALALAVCGLALPTGAPGADSGPRDHFRSHDDHDSDFDNEFEDFNDTLLRMQREAISSQEEQAREAGRAVRRNELELKGEKAAKEQEEFFDAIMEGSRASLKAPAGVPYRKPGYTTTDAPPQGTPVVTVGGIPYLYDQGIFWLQQVSQYIVVTAPAGAVVAQLPAGAVPVFSGGKNIWYYFGVFFTGDAGGYTVIKPPTGLIVFYIPDGYTREKAGGADVFRFGDTLYRPVFIQGVLAYQVTGG